MEYLQFRTMIRFICDFFQIRFKEEYCKALFAQAILETGHFKSQSYKIGNNLFGMKQSKQRTRYWIDKFLNHAKYSDPLCSVMDRLDWDKYLKVEFHDIDQYMGKVLSHKYAEDKEYLFKWKTIYHSLNKI